MEPHRKESVEDLLRHDSYSPEEIAALLQMGVEVIRHAAFMGELPARIVGHDIVSIRREDLLRWLEERDRPEPHRLVGRDD